ncbi:RNA polymerase subunit sigma [Paraliobacillus quinghaiensis]|uniref:RNA polymerase subunit sigma n=1 Tax=Paraliobacillus quinghaiensis TaxID=470815 RepID=A0A917TW37_9BACI|nr:sigma-70 family RNA polymerase sigma factor [Paraliobacillus quinghaiensis]GGM38846.1 RNA polymerase subunit sigma [Paraliobacillus quinghaiensis]
MKGFFRIAGMNYEDVITEYGTGIKQVAYSYVKDKQIAEDITQETFIRCLTKGNKFKREASLRTWLYQIAINLSKDHLRNVYNKRVTTNNELVQSIENKTPSAESIALTNSDKRDITDYILALPEKYREIIILFYFKEFKTIEIAKVLNISENTVKTRLRRSRELLKEGMDKNE